MGPLTPCPPAACVGGGAILGTPLMPSRRGRWPVAWAKTCLCVRARSRAHVVRACIRRAFVSFACVRAACVCACVRAACVHAVCVCVCARARGSTRPGLNVVWCLLECVSVFTDRSNRFALTHTVERAVARRARVPRRACAMATGLRLCVCAVTEAGRQADLSPQPFYSRPSTLCLRLCVDWPSTLCLRRN